MLISHGQLIFEPQSHAWGKKSGGSLKKKTLLIITGMGLLRRSVSLIPRLQALSTTKKEKT